MDKINNDHVFDPFNCDMYKKEENYFICYDCVKKFIKDIKGRGETL